MASSDSPGRSEHEDKTDGKSAESQNQVLCSTGLKFKRESTSLLQGEVGPILRDMEIHLTSETEKRLHALVAQSGGATVDELVQDVIEEYFGDLAQARQNLDRRYDDLESGRVKPVPGDEVIARLRAKSAAHRANRDEQL